MPQRFPKTRDDGSFRIRVRFSSAPNDLASIQRWLSQWVETNREWTFFGETHRFDDYFRGIPEARLGGSGELCLIFNGTSPERRFWRDWYVRLGSATLEAFPEIGDLAAVEDFD
jgi:hypothetical protein